MGDKDMKIKLLKNLKNELDTMDHNYKNHTKC